MRTKATTKTRRHRRTDPWLHPALILHARGYDRFSIPCSLAVWSFPFLSLPAVCLAAALAQTPAPVDGQAIFERACQSCHNGDDPRAPAHDAMAGRSPQAIVDALTSGSMRYQGLALSGPERRAVAEFITGRTLSGTVSGATVGRCVAHAADHGSHSRSAMERLGARSGQHALSTGRAGGSHRRSGAATPFEVGVRLSGHDVRMGAADGCGRPSVRRRSERHRLLARRPDGLHRVDVRSACRCARVDLDRCGESARRRPERPPLRGVLR